MLSWGHSVLDIGFLKDVPIVVDIDLYFNRVAA